MMRLIAIALLLSCPALGQMSTEWSQTSGSNVDLGLTPKPPDPWNGEPIPSGWKQTAGSHVTVTIPYGWGPDVTVDSFGTLEGDKLRIASRRLKDGTTVVVFSVREGSVAVLTANDWARVTLAGRTFEWNMHGTANEWAETPDTELGPGVSYPVLLKTWAPNPGVMPHMPGIGPPPDCDPPPPHDQIDPAMEHVFQRLSFGSGDRDGG